MYLTLPSKARVSITIVGMLYSHTILQKSSTVSSLGPVNSLEYENNAIIEIKKATTTYSSFIAKK